MADYYKILGIKKDASDQEIKSIFRRLAHKYHPDKVAYLGDDIRKKAKEKFQKLHKAYESIKKSRGMS